MQFEKCLTCPLIKEKQCTGPKFMRAPAKDIVAWLFAYMKLHGITNAVLAAASGVPKGTIDGLKNRDDVRHETFVPLLRTAIELTGGVWNGEACPLDYNTAECQQEILDLTQELEHTKALLAQATREKKERTIALMCVFGLCAGLVVLSLLLFLNLSML